jgi:hypothetical protein
MTAEIDVLKSVNLVDFLTAHYHLEFRLRTKMRVFSYAW